MKKKFKVIPKLLGVLAFFMLTNCSKDQFEEQIQNSIDKNTISFEQFKKETGLIDFETTIKIPNNQNISARNADGNYELNDFIIDTELIKRLVIQDKITYSFVIYPNEVTDNSIFNLTVFKIDTEWKISILELVPTEQNRIDLENGTTNKFDGVIKKLYDESITTTNLFGSRVIVISHCVGCIGECDGCNACQTVFFIDEHPLSIASGFTLEPFGTGNSVPHDSGGGNNIENPYYQDPSGYAFEPNLSDLDLEVDNDPNTLSDATNIKRLKKLTKNGTYLKDEIDLLKSKLATNIKEEGMMYGPNLPPLEGACTKNETKWYYDIPTAYFVTVHMHQNNYYVRNTITLAPSNPVMSPEDVFGTLSLYKNNNNINTTTILVSRQGTFALRINNGQQVNDAILAMDPDNNPNTKSPEQELLEDKYNELVMKPFEKVPSDEAGALAGFIQLINTHLVNGQSLGISLFQAVFDGQGKIINWVKL